MGGVLYQKFMIRSIIKYLGGVVSIITWHNRTEGVLLLSYDYTVIGHKSDPQRGKLRRTNAM